MDKSLAARRLSAALGRKISPEEVEYVQGSYVCLGPGKVFKLYAGNACFIPGGKSGEPVWMKNGELWERAWDEKNIPRPLPLD